MNKTLSRLAMAVLALGLIAPMAPARTYHRYRTRSHVSRRYTVAYGANGAWGTIVRKPTMTNRNIRVLFNTGENPILEVPMRATISRNGDRVSVHDLHNGDRVQVWASRGKHGEAMQAWRIRAFSR